jgi:peptidoglycan/xylan/chitin deacetylase (PgdA/CDA1 family)
VRLAILMYHAIDTRRSSVSVSPAMFAGHLAALAASGYTVLPLGEALQWLDGRAHTNSQRLAALTFDDGYASTADIARPLLDGYGWRATVFAISGFVGQDNRWPSQAAEIPAAPLLTWAQLGELSSAGWEIGAHTRTHPDLTRLSSDEIEAEVAGSQRDLRDRLARPVDLFAYPMGRVDGRVGTVVRRHYRAACTTRMGFATPASAPHALERLEMWYFAQPGLHRLFGTRLMRPYAALCRAARRRAR